MVATIRKPAPAFTAEAVINGRFEEVSLKDYLGQYVVLFFYPLDFTFVCPTEIIAFSDRIEDFKKLNTAVLAASVDSKFSHLAWIKHPRNDGGLGEMKIPVISDITKKISKDYGVLIEDDSDADNGVALRGLFIIDTKGVLRQITINDLPVGRNVDEILRLVEAFQYTDEFGEVCPANWTAGKATMVANPEDSKAYFKAQHDANAGQNKRKAH